MTIVEKGRRSSEDPNGALHALKWSGCCKTCRWVCVSFLLPLPTLTKWQKSKYAPSVRCMSTYHSNLLVMARRVLHPVPSGLKITTDRMGGVGTSLHKKPRRMGQRKWRRGRLVVTHRLLRGTSTSVTLELTRALSRGITRSRICLHRYLGNKSRGDNALTRESSQVPVRGFRPGRQVSTMRQSSARSLCTSNTSRLQSQEHGRLSWQERSLLYDQAN